MVSSTSLIFTLITLSSWHLSYVKGATLWSRLRGAKRGQADERHLQQGYYHTLTSSTLGGQNPDAAIGNPLKGLVESPIYTNPPYKADIPLAVEFYYVPFDRVMKGNPNVVGEANAFDWSSLDTYLAESASRNMHAVWRVYVHWPGQTPNVPQYLINAGIERRPYDGELVPYYGDPILLEAFQQFITYSGKRYDGDKRLGYVQAGLLGFWGEWHAGDLLPEASTNKVAGYYAASYTKTQVQVRYANAAAYAAGFGYHDDSFTYQTLDGAANGGQIKSFYFWPTIVRNGQTDFWKQGAMGGEVGDNGGEIFKPTYQARTFQKQDFMECVETTHATYMFHHHSFQNGGVTGAELANARKAHARMGYNYYVSTIGAKASSTSGQVDVDVTVEQIGVAPFYYDLGLGITCPGMNKKTVGGVETLVDKGSKKIFAFTGIPATSQCLGALALSLESSYAYSNRPIKFAQNSGGVVFSIPLPGPVTPTSPVPPPVAAPVAAPIAPPIAAPVSAPVAAPIAPPIAAPVPGPVALPIAAPIAAPVPAPVPAPVAPPIAAPIVSPIAAPVPVQPVTDIKLTLVNANANTGIGPLGDGSTINLMAYPSINVRADVAPFSTGSVQFSLDGKVVGVENTSPFLLNGNIGSDYKGWTLSIGTHTIGATVYSGKNAQGRAGPAITVTVSVLSAPFAAPVTSPIAAPVAAPIAGPVAVPIAAPVAVPIAAPADAPIAAPVATPIATPTASPIAAPVPSPIAAPVAAPIATPIASPIAAPVAAPLAAPTPAQPVMSPDTGTTTDMKLTLVNAISDTDIGPLVDGTIIDMMTYPSITVRADIATFATGSVQFMLDGNVFQTENISPYMLSGNNGSDYKEWAPSVGTHTIGATAYSDDNAKGNAGPTVTVTVTVPSLSFGVVDLVLMDADANSPIESIFNGTTISLSALSTKHLNVQAVTSPAKIGSVRFAYDSDMNYRTERVPPYAIGRDIGGNYLSWTPSVGQHTIVATPLDSSGNEGKSQMVTFTVAN